MNIKAVAILLCDNDFQKTFFPLLLNLHRAFEHRAQQNYELSESHVKQAIYSALEFHYLAHQHRGSNVDHTVQYLRTSIKIVFNAEAVDACLKLDHDGGSWYLDVVTGQITSF